MEAFIRRCLVLASLIVLGSTGLIIGLDARSAAPVPPGAPTAPVLALATPPTVAPGGGASAPPGVVAPSPTVAASPSAPGAGAVPATAARPAATPILLGELLVGPGGFATIGGALAVAAPGATIRIAAGVYREQVDIAVPVTLLPVGDGPVWIDAECKRPNGVRIAAADVTVRGLGVRNSIDAGVLIDGQQRGAAVARATVAQLTVQDFDCLNQGPQFRAGIAAWYAGPGQRVVNNTIIRRVDLPGGLVGGKSNGIWFRSNTNHPSGGGHYIAGNTVQGGYDGIGGEKEDDPRGGFDRDTIIEQNAISDCFDDGISVEGGTQNVRVRGNTITRCAIGLANAPNLTGPVYFEENTITDGRPGDHQAVQCFKIGDRGHGVAYYTGNRCQLGPGANGWGQSNPGVNPIVARDNIIQVGRYVIEIGSAVEEGTSFDGNCLVTTDPERYITWGGVRYADLVAFRRATGQEGRGVAACP